MEFFSQLYIGCQTRDGNLDELFRHENQGCPPALSEAGRLHRGTKSDLLMCLEGLSNAQSEAPIVTNIVLDGAAIIQMLKPGTAKTFLEYASQVFIPYTFGQLQHASRLDLVWDNYVIDSLKATARAKRGKAVCRRVVESAPIPKNWQDFLRVDINDRTVQFPVKELIHSFDTENKEPVVTDGDRVLCVPPQQDIDSLAPCNHEAADSRMMLQSTDITRY